MSMPTEQEKTSLSVESVETHKTKVTVPGLDALHGVIKTTFSLPPFRPELRVRFYPFTNATMDRYIEPMSFILSSKHGASLLSAVLRKTAELIDNYADRLPDKEL